MLLTTERLIIRQCVESDLDDFFALMSDPEVMRFSLKGPLTKEGAKDYLESRILAHYKKHGFGPWAVIYQERFIGLAGLIVQTIDEKEEVELAYRFHVDYWGKGLATEAARGIYRYAFDTLGVDHLISIIDPNNHRSVKLAERIGMQLWKKSTFHGFSVRVYRLNKEA